MKEFIRANKRQLLILALLIVAYLIFRNVGVEENLTSVNPVDNMNTVTTEEEAQSALESKDTLKGSEEEILEETLEEISEEAKESQNISELADVSDAVEDFESETVVNTANEDKKANEDNEIDDADIKQNAENSGEEEKEVDIKYEFRNKNLWREHFEKHGDEFPYETKEDYLIGANVMLNNPNKLHKTEKEDGDDVYYLEETNEFIIVSTDGYLRTYFKPAQGIKYFNRQ